LFQTCAQASAVSISLHASLCVAPAGIQPRQVGCVIVNSSLFNPTPSLSACIMNHFKMGSKTINYNLGGMGCSASLVAIDLAKQVRRGVVMKSESVSE